MLTISRTFVAALAIAAFVAPPALASPADPTGIFEARGEYAGSLISTGPTGIADARGEHAASVPAVGSAADGTAIADARGEHAASVPAPRSQAYANAIADARGEHAATLASTTPGGSDHRSPDAREPIAAEPAGQPVTDVAEPISDGFDWTAAIIGMGAGLALAALAAAGVAGGRRRHVRPSIG